MPYVFYEVPYVFYEVPYVFYEVPYVFYEVPYVFYEVPYVFFVCAHIVNFSINMRCEFGYMFMFCCFLCAVIYLYALRKGKFS